MARATLYYLATHGFDGCQTTAPTAQLAALQHIKTMVKEAAANTPCRENIKKFPDSAAEFQRIYPAAHGRVFADEPAAVGRLGRLELQQLRQIWPTRKSNKRVRDETQGREPQVQARGSMEEGFGKMFMQMAQQLFMKAPEQREQIPCSIN